MELNLEKSINRATHIQNQVNAGVARAEKWLKDPDITKDGLIELGKNVAGYKTSLEGKKSEIATPFYRGHKKLMEIFTPALNKVKRLDDSIRGKIVEFEIEEQRLADEKRNEAIEAAEAKKTQADEELEEVRRKAEQANDPDTIKSLRAEERKKEEAVVNASRPLPEVAKPTRTMSEYNLTDFEVDDFSAVPDEFKMIDRKAVLAALQKDKEIPGITKTIKKAIRRRSR